MPLQSTTRPLPPRFWAKVRARDSGCWEWTGALTKGYGLTSLGRRGEGLIAAHRWAYMALVGPIPAELECDHLCRNRACVNPAHIELVTRKENLRRGVGVGKSGGAHHRKKTHCPQGHDYDYVGRHGWRKCRRCEREGRHRRKGGKR